MPPHTSAMTMQLWAYASDTTHETGLVYIEKWQRHFLHDSPSSMCRATCKRGSGCNLHRRMVETLLHEPISEVRFRYLFFAKLLLSYFEANFWKAENTKNTICYFWERRGRNGPLHGWHFTSRGHVRNEGLQLMAVVLRCSPYLHYHISAVALLCRSANM